VIEAVTLLAANSAAGRAAEARALVVLRAAGYDIVGTQFQVLTSAGKRQIDILVQSGKTFLAVEVKSGGAAYGGTQAALGQLIAGGGGTFLRKGYQFLSNVPIQTYVLYLP
jgi:hypothetical protein